MKIDRILMLRACLGLIPISPFVWAGFASHDSKFHVVKRTGVNELVMVA